MNHENAGGRENEPTIEVSEEEIKLAISFLERSIKGTENSTGYITKESKQDDLKIKNFALEIVKSGVWKEMRTEFDQEAGEMVKTDNPDARVKAGPWIHFEQTIKDWAQQEINIREVEEKS